MNRLVACVLLAGVGLLPAPALAGTTTGKIKTLIARASDGLQYVFIDGVTSGAPACGAAHGYFIIKDEKSDTGKAQFAMLMSAYFAGKPVIIFGSGQCTRWSDGEDIDGVTLGEL
jgi:hypothetical protein